MKKDTFKEEIRAGKVMYGTFVKANSTPLIEVLGYAGLDFAVVDMEHANISLGDIERIVTAADVVDLPILVRIPAPTEEYVLHVLDSGACGVQVPGLEKASDAENIISYGKYYPDGNRGLTYNQRVARFGFCDKSTYKAEQNRLTIITIQVENAAMVEEVEALCQLEHVDILFIGPMDLSTSLGVSGQVDHPLVQKAIKKTVDAAKKSEKALGIFITKEGDIKKYVDMGFQYIMWSSDVGFCVEGAKRYMEKTKGL